MVNFVILVFVGGGFGAMLRELIMVVVPNLADSFPPDILVANLVAAFLLGLVTALHRSQVVSDEVNMLVGTGITGGMSTFSSFAYGAVVLMSASAESAAVASAAAPEKSLSFLFWGAGGVRIAGHRDLYGIPLLAVPRQAAQGIRLSGAAYGDPAQLRARDPIRGGGSGDSWLRTERPIDDPTREAPSHPDWYCFLAARFGWDRTGIIRRRRPSIA